MFKENVKFIMSTFTRYSIRPQGCQAPPPSAGQAGRAQQGGLVCRRRAPVTPGGAGGAAGSGTGRSPRTLQGQVHGGDNAPGKSSKREAPRTLEETWGDPSRESGCFTNCFSGESAEMFGFGDSVTRSECRLQIGRDLNDCERRVTSRRQSTDAFTI